MAQGKVAIDSSKAVGTIFIPEGISSGTYYLKAYTRWMRNCGSESMAYTSVRIYDSFNDSSLPVDSAGWDPLPAGSAMNQLDIHPAGLLECSLERSSFQTREEVLVKLDWKHYGVPMDVTVSVARNGLLGNQEYFGQNCQFQQPENLFYLPETRGLSLTGQTVGASNASPVPYASIYVTMLGAEGDFFCNYSDSVGRFYFSFPDYSGSRELFVSTYHPEYPDLELLIDRDFSQDAPQLPSYPVPLNDSLTALITEMSVNAQVSQQYYPRSISQPKQDTAGELLFYGHPMATIEFKDFIKLPRLEEYFVEVIPQVAVRKDHGVRRLVILGEHPDLSIYPPLVMIDGVAIFDVEAVLAVSPRLIDRVEIINAPYIRGNVTFGGIVSLISKNKDMGYIDLPSSGLLVDYRMLDLPWTDPLQNGVPDPRLPYVRNTLYWNPGLKLNPENTQQISFQTSDLKGAYEILIRGYDSNGKFLEKRIPFTVE